MTDLGKNKTYPSNKDLLSGMIAPSMVYLHFLLQWGIKYPTLGKTVMLRVYSKPRENENGIKITPMSQAFEMPEGMCTLPNAALNGVHKEAAVMYLHAVFSLREESVNYIECFFPALGLR